MRIEDIKKDYLTLCSEIPEMSKFSLREYLKASMIIASRAFGTIIDGKETTSLVPYADMFNH